MTGSWLLFLPQYRVVGVPDGFDAPTCVLFFLAVSVSVYDVDRRRHLPIDTISFSFVIRDDVKSIADLTAAPEDGCFIHGLFLEGARWDR